MVMINCIVCAPGIEYEYMYQRPQQLLRACSNLGIKVIYLSPNQFLTPLNTSSLPAAGSNFLVIHQPEAVDYLSELSPIVYFSAPAALPEVLSMKPGLLIFDSVDDPSEEFSAWYPNYQQAIETADMVLASSQQLYQSALTYNSSTYLLPNACDYDFFSQDHLTPPQDLPLSSGPIIGYCGAVASWCDLGLIEFLADSAPEYQLVMIGPLYNLSSVPQRPNIHWLGYKPYNQLPAYLSHFDVGIIPFRISRMTRAVNPIKMWEYLAAGIPVVSTDLPETRGYGDLVLVAENRESFLMAVNKALSEKGIDKKARRRQLALQNSWESRALQLLNIIDEHLMEREIISQPALNWSTLQKYKRPTIAYRKSIPLSTGADCE